MTRILYGGDIKYMAIYARMKSIKREQLLLKTNNVCWVDQVKHFLVNTSSQLLSGCIQRNEQGRNSMWDGSDTKHGIFCVSGRNVSMCQVGMTNPNTG